ncbi:MAG: 50S ribosomal protein L38e [Thermoprotei archaeon]|nr:MAG: 50S ribosomal protein L38e [Thermoprotei archaeon]RLF23178.1 MAG: 50S ribosomal protein L38e [Thermoprotei archaeon]
MPKEIFDKEEFIKLSEVARECRVKRLGDIVKLKLRLRRYLYTIKVKPEEAEEILKRIKCPVREL